MPHFDTISLTKNEQYVALTIWSKVSPVIMGRVCVGKLSQNVSMMNYGAVLLLGRNDRLVLSVSVAQGIMEIMRRDKRP